MPTQRFRFLSVIVASSAAVGGLLGAFVAVGVLTIPGTQGNGKVATPSAQETKASPPAQAAKASPPAETTGSAIPGDNLAAAGCDQQTWPNLSQPCVEELQRKSKNVRVITTDRLDQPTVGAIEAPKPAPQSKTDTTAAVQPVAPPVASTVTPPAASAQAPAKSLPVATAEPWFKPEAPAAQEIQTAPPQTTPQQAAPQSQPAKAVAASDDVKATSAQDEAKAKSKAERVAKKAKRKPKSPQLDTDDDGVSTVASTDDDRRDRRSSRASKEPRRIVERWTEREYRSDTGQRRVTVTRRGGGIFENLFGMGRRDDD